VTPKPENAPAGDYAEYLVATALGGHLAPNSEKSWDVLGSGGEKLQVKARVVTDPPSRANCSCLRYGHSASTPQLSSCCRLPTTPCRERRKCLATSSSLPRSTGST
jgi:hypothetical protein